MMAVNLCTAHKKADSRAGHEVLATRVLLTIVQHTKMDLMQLMKYSSRVLYMKFISHVTREFRLSYSTKIEEHVRVPTHKHQLRH